MALCNRIIFTCQLVICLWLIDGLHNFFAHLTFVCKTYFFLYIFLYFSNPTTFCEMQMQQNSRKNGFRNKENRKVSFTPPLNYWFMNFPFIWVMCTSFYGKERATFSCEGKKSPLHEKNHSWSCSLMHLKLIG